MNSIKPTNIKTKWDLSSLFKDDADPEIEEYKSQIENAYKQFVSNWQSRTDYIEKPEILKIALDEYEKLSQHYGGGGKLGYYVSLRNAVDQTNTDLKGLSNRINDFIDNLDNTMLFFTLNISKMSTEKQKIFLQHEGLKPYKHFLEKCFASSKYLLTEDQEKILNLKSGPAHSNWTKMISEFLSREEREIINESGEKEVQNLSTLINTLNCLNERARDSAADAINEIFGKYLDVAEHEINSVLQNKKIDDDLRHAKRPDEIRHVNDDIDTEIVDSLVKAVSDNFEISRKYYQLKAKLSGKSKLKYHERNVPYGQIKQKYSYEDALLLVHKTFNKLDPLFAEYLEMLNNNGCIDVYPQKGKQNGAFCAHHTPTTPTYILLNHTDTLDNVLTLAHELGHALNNEFIKRKQNSINFGTPTSTAEVASTFFEDFVFEEILNDADDELRLNVMMNKLNDDVSTIFRQIAFYNFEKDLHHSFREKGYLSKSEIGNLFQKHMQSYMGDFVDQPETAKNWWIYVNHFRYFFYVYSYAGGLLISKSMQNSVKSDHHFIEKVKAFLEAGESTSPKEIFTNLNVDITQPEFWNKGILEIQKLLTETEEIAKKLGKI